MNSIEYTQQRNAGPASIAVMTALVCLSACGGPDRSDEMMVPDPDRIPFINNDHIEVDASDGFRHNPDALPLEVRMLKEYLEEPEAAASQRVPLDIPQGLSQHLRIISADAYRLLILDRRDGLLLEYNLTDQTVWTVAEPGEGPGELMFPRNVVTNDGKVYVAGFNRLDVFDCDAAPCTYSRTIGLDIRPTALAFIGAGSPAVSFTPDVSSIAGPQSDDDLGTTAVRVMSHDGEPLYHIGEAYDVAGHWMLLDPLVGDSHIAFSMQTDELVLAFSRFPLIYVYGTDGRLKRTYRLEPFTVGQQRYNTRIGALDIVLEDHSVIDHMGLVNDTHLLAEVTTRMHSRVVGRLFEWDVRRDYFLIDLSNGGGSHLGRAEGTSTRIHGVYPVEGGIVLYVDGTLYRYGVQG